MIFAPEREAREIAADVSRELHGHRWRGGDRQALLEDACDQHASDSPVPVSERMDRLELSVGERRQRDRVEVIAVGERGYEGLSCCP